jgi:hypothetical protein
VAIILVLSLMSADYFQFRYNRSAGYQDQKKIIQALLKQPEKNIYVYTDLVQSRYGSFYAQYDSTRIHFYPYAAFEKYGYADAVFVLENSFTGWMTQTNSNSLPDTVSSRLIPERVVQQVNAVKLYRIK